MLFKVVVFAAVASLASAGFDANYMNMMLQMMSSMKQNQTQQISTPQIPTTGNCANGQCSIPQGVDVTTYIAQQQQQQQYQMQQMNAKIKAQFEGIMNEVTMKRHRYAMGVMTEFTSMCGCLQSQLTTYQSMFVANAHALNMTDVYDLNQDTKLPYQATTLKEARERIFYGMVKQMCTRLSTFMNFAEQVEQQLAQLNPTRAPIIG